MNLSSKHSCTYKAPQWRLIGFWPCYRAPVPCHVKHSSSCSSSSRSVAARMYRKHNDDLADRTKEVWDDEEDIKAAAERLGYKGDQQFGDSGPLLTEMNKLYLSKDSPKAYIGKVELRYLPGRGYGIVASQQIQKGQVLAICPPLAWVAGPPGQPPRLEALIRHVNNTCYNTLQINALESLCSLPAIDAAHDEQHHDPQKQLQQAQADRLLQAGNNTEITTEQQQGTTVSSLPLSKSAAIKRMQQQLQEQQGWESNNADTEPAVSSSSRWRRGSSSSSTSQLMRNSEAERRRMPDLLELMECTAKSADEGNITSAGGGTASTLASSSSSRGWGDSSSSSSSRGWSDSSRAGASGRDLQQLSMSSARLTALICRNSLSEMNQDLLACNGRGERPASITGLWPLLATFNHSCAPNAVAVAMGAVPAAVTQQQPLLPGQQQQQQQLNRGTAAAATAAMPVNKWARSHKANLKSSSSSSGSRNASLSAPGSSVLGLSQEVGVGPFVVVRAVTDMKAGDEISLDYLAPSVEGSFIHPDKRRAILAQRWGFRCRCERCQAETAMSKVVSRCQHSANALAAKLGPQVSSAIAAADTAALAAAAEALRAAVLRLEKEVNEPTIQVRAAAWTHASIYQAHALLAVCRMAVSPTALPSLASVGTAMEVLGCAGPGSSNHILAAASLLLSAQDTWGDEDDRTHAAARGLLEVMQLRYGPLESVVAQELVKAAQRWAYELSQTRLGLVAPTAAAAARARLAIASKDRQARTAAAASSKGSSSADGSVDGVIRVQEMQEVQTEKDEPDELANALELEAEEVLEVTDEILKDIYQDEDAELQQPPPDDILVKQRSQQDVIEELQLFAGYAQALPPEQRFTPQQGAPRQQDLHQRTSTADSSSSNTAAVASTNENELALDADVVVDSAVDLPMASWLQGSAAAETSAEDDVLIARQQQQQQLPVQTSSAWSAGTQRQQQQHEASGSGKVAPAVPPSPRLFGSKSTDDLGSNGSSSSKPVVGKPVSSLFTKKGKLFSRKLQSPSQQVQQQPALQRVLKPQQQQQQQQRVSSAAEPAQKSGLQLAKEREERQKQKWLQKMHQQKLRQRQE